MLRISLFVRCGASRLCNAHSALGSALTFLPRKGDTASNKASIFTCDFGLVGITPFTWPVLGGVLQFDFLQHWFWAL